MDADEYAVYIYNGAAASTFDVIIEHNGIQKAPTTTWLNVTTINVPDQNQLYEKKSDIFYRAIRVKIANITGNPIVSVVIIKRNTQFYQQQGGVI